MTMSEFLKWVIDHKEYAPLYSSVVATGALIFSILSFIISNIISKNRAKKDKLISDARYEEQKRQYESRLAEESKRRKEDLEEANRRIRISEQPYLVFKSSKVYSPANCGEIRMRFNFINKGRGTAYSINSDLDFWSSLENEGNKLKRGDAIEDPIVTVGEEFSIDCVYNGDEKKTFKTRIVVSYEDASGCKYKQEFNLVVADRIGNSSITNYAIPELLEE